MNGVISFVGEKGKKAVAIMYIDIYLHMFRNILDEYTESLTGYFVALDLYGEVGM